MRDQGRKPRLGPRADRRDEERCETGRQLLVVGKGRRVDEGLGLRDGLLVEGRQAARDAVGLLLELVVRHDPVDVAIALRECGVDVVGDEQHLQGPAAAYQSRQARHRTAPGTTPVPTSNCARIALSPARRMSQARANSLPAPRVRPRSDAMLTTGARLSRAVKSSQGMHPGRPGRHRDGLRRIAFGVVVGEEELGVAAREDDNREVRVALDRVHEAR